jgi:hypothetical protein
MQPNIAIFIKAWFGYNYRSGIPSILFDNEAQDFQYASQLQVLVFQVFLFSKDRSKV